MNQNRPGILILINIYQMPTLLHTSLDNLFFTRNLSSNNYNSYSLNVGTES